MSPVEQEIRRLEDDIGRAIVARDLAFVDRLWDDDFCYTGIRGERKGKAEILAELTAGVLKFEQMRFEDLEVRVHTDVAVVAGLAITAGQSPQGPITGRFRYTRVYVRKQAEWKLVAFHGCQPPA
jgi:ketosteroid isomerase-like protein